MVQITNAWGHFLRDGPRRLDASMGTLLAWSSVLRVRSEQQHGSFLRRRAAECCEVGHDTLLKSFPKLDASRVSSCPTDCRVQRPNASNI